VNASLQLSLSIVLAMICMLMTGNYVINRYQLLIETHREHTIEKPLVEIKNNSPRIIPKHKYVQIVEDVARTYGLDSALLYAVISVESGYNPKAISKNGASGLMQLMPNIANRYGVVDLLDPVQNLHGGAKYLRDMLILFKNDVSLAVAAYNAGETAVVRYGNRIPPYRETMDFVPRVLNIYREYQENRPRPSDVLFVKGRDDAMLCNGVVCT
jgi:soluble lytic murein transglycosylase-like protein